MSIDAAYCRLAAKGEKVFGFDIYEIPDRALTPKIRAIIGQPNLVWFSPIETDRWLLRRRADVTGNPYDDGYILRRKAAR